MCLRVCSLPRKSPPGRSFAADGFHGQMLRIDANARACPTDFSNKLIQHQHVLEGEHERAIEEPRCDDIRAR